MAKVVDPVPGGHDDNTADRARTGSGSTPEVTDDCDSRSRGPPVRRRRYRAAAGEPAEDGDEGHGGQRPAKCWWGYVFALISPVSFAHSASQASPAYSPRR